MGRALPPDCEFFAEISKIDLEQRLVFGYASTDARDRQGEIITRDAIEKALPGYMMWGNVREMHGQSAVGKAAEARMDDKGLWFGAKVVDDRAWTKVKEGVYKGFSIGGRVVSRDPDDKTIIKAIDLTEISLVDRPANPAARFEFFKRADDHLAFEPVQYWGCGCKDHQHLQKAEARECMADAAERLNVSLKGGELLKFNPNHGEHGMFAQSNTALAEHAQKLGETHMHNAAEHEAAANANSGHASMHLSAARDHTMAATEYRHAGSLYRTNNALLGDEYMRRGMERGAAAYRTSSLTPASGVQLRKADDVLELVKRDFSDKQRDKAADSGAALPDGSFPIENKDDLRNAVTAVGRAKDYAKAKAHIISRAKSLGAASMLPDEWHSDDAAKRATPPRAIQGGQFAGHLKSADEAGRMASDHAAKAAACGALCKKHELLAAESAKAGNAMAVAAHTALAKSHKQMATRHENLADKYTRLAAKHGDWAQKSADAPDHGEDRVAIAKRALATKRAGFQQAA